MLYIHTCAPKYILRRRLSKRSSPPRDKHIAEVRFITQTRGIGFTPYSATFTCYTLIDIKSNGSEEGGEVHVGLLLRATNACRVR